MAKSNRAHFYLDDAELQRYQKGHHNFLNKVMRVLNASDITVRVKPNTEVERFKALTRRGNSLSYMTSLPNDSGLIYRKMFYFPFWQIEESDTVSEWRVRKAKFDPQNVDKEAAQKFFEFWQERLFPEEKAQIGDEGYILIALSDRELEAQYEGWSSLEMIKAVRKSLPEQDLVVMKPSTPFSYADDLLLETLEHEDGKLRVVEHDPKQHLPRCHGIATQEAHIAFDGYFVNKPAILFAATDIDHIALSPDDAHLISEHKPDFARYLWWFWQEQSINAGHPNAEKKIYQQLKAAQWPLKGKGTTS